jgi:hypothetical protein
MPSPQVQLVGLDVGRARLRRKAIHPARQPQVERLAHRARDLLLDREDVARLAVVGLGPELEAGPGVHELGRDPDPLAGLPHAALEDRADAELLAERTRVEAPSLERERRRAPGHPQLRKPAQRADQLSVRPSASTRPRDRGSGCQARPRAGGAVAGPGGWRRVSGILFPDSFARGAPTRIARIPRRPRRGSPTKEAGRDRSAREAPAVLRPARNFWIGRRPRRRLRWGEPVWDRGAGAATRPR